MIYYRPIHVFEPVFTCHGLESLSAGAKGSTRTNPHLHTHKLLKFIFDYLSPNFSVEFRI